MKFSNKLNEKNKNFSDNSIFQNFYYQKYFLAENILKLLEINFC